MGTNLRPDAKPVRKDGKARASLSRYFAVMQNEKNAKFQMAKKLPADFEESDSLSNLWQEHVRLSREFQAMQERLDAESKNLLDMSVPRKSYLDLKITIARKLLRNCHLCFRACNVDRIGHELGYCRCGHDISISSIFEHMGEEPELVPSGTIFTMGCTMRCKHCQNYTISQWMENGRQFGPQDLAEEIDRLRLNGCRNANLVGGEPTPWLPRWLETFKHVSVNVPVVWNSNSYYSQDSAKLLAGFADVYLLDFKYGPSNCAERISDAPNYWAVCTRNHLEARKHGELLIRLLVLPGHLECCVKPIIDWVGKNLGDGARVNVMFQYSPEWRAFEVSELQRRLTKVEREKAIQLAEQAGLTNFMT